MYLSFKKRCSFLQKNNNNNNNNNNILIIFMAYHQLK